MPYAGVGEAIEYYAGSGVNSTELDVTMRQAAREVQRYAPVPSPVPSDYTRMAADAELDVGRYLWNTEGGAVTSSSLSGAGSVTYVSRAHIRNLVKNSMAVYYGAGATSTSVVSSFAEETPAT